MEQKMKIPGLPEDLIIEIQLRLSVKSVIRFKSVSKSWLARFQNPDFIRSHFVKHKDLDGDNLDNSVILLPGRSYSSYPSSDFFIKMEERNSTLTATEKIRFPVLPEEARWSIQGQCMGIICLRFCEKLALWNPTTKEFKLLPRFYRSKVSYSCVAFGYDHKTSDFKVIRYVHKVRLGLLSIEPSVVEIYSLNRNKWRELPINTKLNYGIGFSIFINGVCHWAEYNDDAQSFIVSFDMTNETFRTTRVNLGESNSYMFRLFSFGECLGAVYSSYHSSGHFDIWKLNDLEDRASWTKQELNPKGLYSGFWKSGQIFIRTWHANDDLVLHDPKTGNDRIIGSFIKADRLTNTFSSFIYVESLYQLKGRSEEKEEIQRIILSVPEVPLS